MMTTLQKWHAQTYIDQVARVYEFLSGQSDLSPRNAAVTATLYRFVLDTMKKRSPQEVEAILGAPVIRQVVPGLRKLLGQAEYEMECYCANAMVGRVPGVERRFSAYGHFIYRHNYEALVAAELNAMKWPFKAPPIKKNSESVAFVGAGPLPISAIMFHRRTGLPVTCVDSDEQACHLGRQLVLHLAATEPGYQGLDNAIHFVCAQGEEHDYVTHPIVFIASLVEKKDRVVSRIVKTSHTVATTIIRSADGLSTLLYEPADCVGGQEQYNVYLAGKTRSSPEAINSSLVYRFPPGKYWARNKIDRSSLPTNDAAVGLRPVRLWRTRPYDIAI